MVSSLIELVSMDFRKNWLVPRQKIKKLSKWECSFKLIIKCQCTSVDIILNRWKNVIFKKHNISFMWPYIIMKLFRSVTFLALKCEQESLGLNTKWNRNEIKWITKYHQIYTHKCSLKYKKNWNFLDFQKFNIY